MPSPVVLTVHLAQETDFLLARQRAKQLAALLGFERQDQTRLATAVSEIARNAFQYATAGKVEFFVDADHLASAQLRIEVSDRGPGIPTGGGPGGDRNARGIGIAGAQRMVDGFEITTGSTGSRVSMRKLLPGTAPVPPSAGELARALAVRSPTNLDALHEQNQELLTLLSELRTREAELKSLNKELADTNRGVLVLYKELEDTAHSVQQASEMKTRFLSGVTHELRTPLNSVVSLARLLLTGVDGQLNPEQEKQVQFILRSASNLTEMVNDLLDLARVEAGKIELKITEFAVSDLFAGLRGMFRPLATNERVSLVFDLPDTPLTVRSDEGKVAQILRNFVANALKFTDQGSIEVSVRPASSEGSAEGSIVFSVKDTGIGIALEHHDLVMQEWGQVNPTAHGRNRGSGLGLPLSRSLATLLGGSVDFVSSAGTGSTFRLTIPGLLQDGKPEVASPTEAIVEDGHILMADDDEIARYLLRRRLSRHTTAAIHEATSGQEALEAIRKHRPHILFLDLIMPGLSGMEVVRQLRNDPLTRDLPIVLHTSKILTPDERLSLETLDLTHIPKRGTAFGRESTQGENEEQNAQLERALLQVGLSNSNQRERTT